MQPKEKLEYIRQACIKANPSIVELVFGCRVINEVADVRPILRVLDTDETKQIVYCTYAPESPNKTSVLHIFHNHLSIIGREIRLADVLLAMTKVYNERDTIDDSRNYHKNGKIIPLSDFFAEICCLYNLTQDNLELQSEETRSFIYELLK